MNIKIHCPGCQAQLRVPADSSGRRARCPKCSKKFIIPNPSELFEETVSTWIERDVEDVRRTGPEDGSEADKDMTILGEAVGAASSIVSGSPPPREEPRAKEPSVATAPKPKAPPSKSEAPAGGAKQVPSEQPARASKSASDEAPQATAPDRPVRRDVAPGSKRPDKAYPTELRPSWDRPYLVVLSCDQNGVRFAFDSVWLEDEGFRASFPVQCVFTGVDQEDHLVARPLAFVDQAGAARSASQIERGHEHRLQRNQTTRELLRAMGDLTGLPRPFSRTMPYFISHEMSSRSLKCSTRTREGGGVTCEVIVPDAATALHWLERVNGVCGIEYELLSHDIHEVGGDAWRGLSEKCRQRLNVWCHFEPGEVFRLYVNDADFAASDAGLAGLVVTDQRLIFHKYHHSGEISLDTEAILRIRLDDVEFATIVLEHERDRTRVAKLHRQDLAKLGDAIRGASGLRMETGNLAAEGTPAG